MLKKIIISILLIFNIVFLNISSCYAISSVDGAAWNYFIDKLENIHSLNDVIDLMHRGSFGLIPSSSDFNKNNEAWDELNQWITGNLNDKGVEEPTEEDKVQELKSHITINDNSVVTDTELNTVINNILNNYVSDNKSYVYTLDILHNGVVSNMNAYFALRDKIRNHIDKLYVIYTYGSQPVLYEIGFNDIPYLYVTDNSIALANNVASCTLRDFGTGLNLDRSEFGASKFNPETNKFDIGVESTSGTVQAWAKYDKDNSSDTSRYSNTWFIISCNVTIPIRYFPKGYTPTVQDVLYQPYYYNNAVWQDFSTSSGDYTWSPSNINTVTYGDVTSYIDNSNTENGYPPSVQDINIHIEDKDEENKDTSSGGGSGSGGDDSGGSGGGIGSVGDIFGWLKQLGSVIASLIKGIGEFVTEVVTGLVAAITDLLGGIGDLITSITETLPTTFMTWFGTLFEWMPAEWKALLSASLVFMVLWGIIKLIRG